MPVHPSLWWVWKPCNCSKILFIIVHDIKFHLWASSACQDAFFSWTTAFSLRQEGVVAQAVLISSLVEDFWVFSGSCSSECNAAISLCSGSTRPGVFLSAPEAVHCYWRGVSLMPPSLPLSLLPQHELRGSWKRRGCSLARIHPAWPARLRTVPTNKQHRIAPSRLEWSELPCISASCHHSWRKRILN